MKIDIVGRPVFYLPLSLEQVELCIKLSGSHYDGVCKSASLPGDSRRPAGFLEVWRRSLSFAREYPEEQSFPQEATWRELDTLLKILENILACDNEEQRHAVWALVFTIRGAMTTANDLANNWKGEFTHKPCVS